MKYATRRTVHEIISDRTRFRNMLGVRKSLDNFAEWFYNKRFPYRVERLRAVDAVENKRILDMVFEPGDEQVLDVKGIMVHIQNDRNTSPQRIIVARAPVPQYMTNDEAKKRGMIQILEGIVAGV